jgi:beta-carotene/zeaxanthin 4-ketolase
MQHSSQPPPLTGLWVAAVIIVLWVGSLAFLLHLDIDRLALLWILLATLGRVFIQTGLFIVAHDAIHGVVLPSHGAASPVANRRWNNIIGQLAVTLYALLPYRKLALNHWQHHRYPGQSNDPDFHDGIHHSLFAWYLKFMSRYLDLQQKLILFFGIGAIFFALHWGLHVALLNIFLFWIIPIVLSSMQLFFFGTYLPHRFTNSKFDQSSPIASIDCSPVVSFLTCYHFGYHWEHHEYPDLPWYDLPLARQLRKSNSAC